MVKNLLSPSLTRSEWTIHLNIYAPICTYVFIGMYIHTVLQYYIDQDFYPFLPPKKTAFP